MTPAMESDRPDGAGRPGQPVRAAAEDGNEPQRLLLTVVEAAQMLSVGRTTLFGLIRSGQLASVRIGSARRVSVRAIEEFVDQLTRRIPPPDDAAFEQNAPKRRVPRRLHHGATRCEVLRLPFAGGDHGAERN